MRLNCEGNMNKTHTLLKRIARLGLIVMMGVGMSACSSSDTWKEEVLLHDGSQIVVERTQYFGWNLLFTQRPPIKEQTITFTLPSSNKPVTWKSEFSKDVGHYNFQLLGLDIVNGSAYVVTQPFGCEAYNKWGRPNPPYISFKHANEQWVQIPLADLPAEIKQPNVLIDTYGHGDVDRAVGSGVVAVDVVKKLNGELTQQHLKNIVRLPVKHEGRGGCGVLVRIEGTEGGWVSPGGAKAPIPVVSPTPSKK